MRLFSLAPLPPTYLAGSKSVSIGSAHQSGSFVVPTIPEEGERSASLLYLQNLFTGKASSPGFLIAKLIHRRDKLTGVSTHKTYSPARQARRGF